MNDPQEQGTQQQAQEQQVRVGFEATLDKYVPNWKEQGEDLKVRNAIEFTRAIYLQGLIDASVFINSSLIALSEGHNWLLNSVRVVGHPAPAADVANAEQNASAMTFAASAAETSVTAQQAAVATQLQDAESRTDLGENKRLRGETSSITRVDELAFQPQQGTVPAFIESAGAAPAKFVVVDTLGAVPQQGEGEGDPVFVKDEDEFHKIFGADGTHDDAGASRATVGDTVATATASCASTASESASSTASASCGGDSSGGGDSGGCGGGGGCD